MNFRTLITLVLLGAALQASALTSPAEADAVRRAQMLLDYGRYADARPLFSQMARSGRIASEQTRDWVYYGLAVSRAELIDEQAAEVMNSYLQSNPMSVYSGDIRFRLAELECERGNYQSARTEFLKCPYKSLDLKSRERYDIRMGYISFIQGDYSSADGYFSKIDKRSEYWYHALYYRSYIAYANGESDRAYDGFKALENGTPYSPLMPFYIFNLEFSRGNYQETNALGMKILSQGTTPQQRLSILRVMSESWFRLEEYRKGATYIAQYRKEGGEMGREENYLLGYSSYRLTDYTTARDSFEKCVTGDDALCQNAAYHLGDCAVRLNDKRAAMQAFSIASSIMADPVIREESMFGYAKLNYELGGTFNEAINILLAFIEAYPQSKHLSEARVLLVAAYYNSNNYEMALESISRLGELDSDLKLAKQKILFRHAMQLYSSGELSAARREFMRSKEVGVSARYNALSQMWIGETSYAMGEMQSAISGYNAYLGLAPRQAAEYADALYGLGYAYYQTDDNQRAKDNFSKMVSRAKRNDPRRADALNRLGDIEFSSRDYNAAVGYYDQAAAMRGPAADYARFQKAQSLGVLGRNQEKISILRQLASSSGAGYADRAEYEMGKTMVNDGDYRSAKALLEKFVKRYPDSEYLAQAYLALGLSYVNLSENSRALQSYERVVALAAGTPLAKDAMQAVREIYVSEGRISDYLDYARKNGAEGDMSRMTMDSLSYRSAQNAYLAGRYQSAIPQMNSYIESFPQGYYRNEAMFLLSDCYLRQGDTDNALIVMKTLSEAPRSEYTIPVLEKMASVSRSQKMYAETDICYRRLYSMTDDGAKRSEYASHCSSAALESEDERLLGKLLAQSDAMPEIPQRDLRAAKGMMLHFHQARNEMDKVYEMAEQLSSDMRDKAGAEAQYLLIRRAFMASDLDKAEKMVYSFSESGTTQSYWLAMAFITLGDVYAARSDTFQARATYQSVIDGYTPADDGVVALAREQLSKIQTVR